MKPNVDKLKDLESKPKAKDDLKSLPMPELQARLGSSSDGLSQAEAQIRLTQYGPITQELYPCSSLRLSPVSRPRISLLLHDQLATWIE